MANPISSRFYRPAVQRATRGCRASDRKQVPDGVVSVGRHVPTWINDSSQSSQSIINVLDRVALRPQRRRKTENEREEQSRQRSLPHHRTPTPIACHLTAFHHFSSVNATEGKALTIVCSPCRTAYLSVPG